jgi:radical SAM superfamily enzyme YgiQ (UPF0313 family)
MLLINPVNRIYGGMLNRYVPLLVPMTLGYLASGMLENGFTVRLYDEKLEKITAASLDEIVAGLPTPYIFGISVITAQAARAYQLARLFKERYPDATVILGGYHPTALPEEALSIKAVDFVVRGEGERALVELYRALREGAQDFSHIKGISFRKDNSLYHTADMPLTADLDTLPDFPYHLFSDLLQRARSRQTYDWGCIVTSRGCPYRCTYCSQRMLTGASYRFRSTEKVIAELNFLVETFKVRQVFFMDDDLLVNKPRIQDLCEHLYEGGLAKKCVFSLQTRAVNFNPDIARLLKKAGFTSVSLGMEVGTNRLAELINKEQTVEDYCAAVACAKQHGMDVNLFMMFGLPTETAKDRQRAFAIAKKLKPSLLKFSNLVPYPGTPMYESVRRSKRLNVTGYWENFTNSLNESGFSSSERPLLPYVPETTSEWELTRDIIKYNFLMMIHPHALITFMTGKKGIGVLVAPPEWYKRPQEYFHLIKIGIALWVIFFVVLLPLWLTEPIVNLLFPKFQRRIPAKKRTLYTPHHWSESLYQKTFLKT